MSLNGLLRMLFGINKLPEKDFSEYLPADHDFFVVECTSNIIGTSRDYNGNTLNEITKLNTHEKLRLVVAETPTESGLRVQVFKANGKQIGWFADECWFGSELLNQLTFGIDVYIECSNKGLVYATNIPWCETLLRINVPFPAGEPCVYIANSGKLYHSNSGCNKYARHRVPLSHAQWKELHPCSKCVVGD